MKDQIKLSIMHSILKALYYTKAYKLLENEWRGIGLIYMLHRINPVTVSNFSPNSVLQITPDFLEAAINQALENGYDVVSLDEAYRRLVEKDYKRRFVCFTFDDGYKDNMHYAWPIFKKYNLPFAIYVPSDYPSGKGELWWIALETIIAQNDFFTLDLPTKDNNGYQEHKLVCQSEVDKWTAWKQIYPIMRYQMNEDEQRDFIKKLCLEYDVDFEQICKDEMMDWGQIRKMDKDPLVTIAGHTVSHRAVGKLSSKKSHREIEQGLSSLEQQLGHKIEHFSYPYGNEASAGKRDFQIAKHLGLKTAVTTRKGVLFEEHKDHLMALPRLSLNGDYQSLEMNKVLMSGAAFALFNKFQRLNVS